jgi:Right handed beta helix region
MSRTWLLTLMLASVLLPAAAAAKLCGMNVKGQRVPCACGDVVVSDLTLSDDPVTLGACPGTALVVRAAGAARGVTIDLAGKTLRGSGTGTGIWVVYGGPGGARLVSSAGTASISGFIDGVVAHGSDTLALLDHVTVSDIMHDGVRVDAVGYAIHASEVDGAGRDGFSLGGSHFRITASRAVRCRRYGYFVMGRAGVIGSATGGDIADASGMAGFDVMGMAHHLVDCTATNGHKWGIRVSGMFGSVIGCRVAGNAGDGITGTGMGWRLAHNQVFNNRGNGLVVHGVQLADGGGNRAAGNGTADQPHPATQCEIASAPCAP